MHMIITATKDVTNMPEMNPKISPQTNWLMFLHLPVQFQVLVPVQEPAAEHAG